MSEQQPPQQGVVITAEQAYRALLKGSGRKKIKQLREMLETYKPEEVMQILMMQQAPGKTMNPATKRLLELAIEHIAIQVAQSKARKKRPARKKRR
jgi:hypothetical protein